MTATSASATAATPPVDPTTTEAWAALEAHSLELTTSLREMFAADPQRAERFTLDAADLHVDLSKNAITEETVQLLLQLAREVGLEQRREAMFTGAHINTTEDRAVLHTALRRPAGAAPALEVDGQQIDQDVHETLQRVYAFARKIRSGEWTGMTGKPIRTVVNIGIGGSDLGPVMVYEALRPLAQESLSARFVSNIDPTDAYATTADLDPETTLVIVASKTFTTLETITNARLVRQWLLDGLREQAGLTAEQETEAVAKHFVAVSTALDKVEEFGIDPANAFGFWNWVGGRYSVDSAIGTVLATVLGPEAFEELLAGFHAMDEHFRTAPAEANVPLLMGLLNVWNVNFLEAETHAVLPYSQYLHRFPAYLQQLTMESNGKSVRWDGSLATTETGEVFWGEPGTNGQHAFYQLIHQGTRVIPADFIAFATPNHALRDGEQDVHELFLANFFAQTKALAFGKTAEEVRAEGTEGALVAAREFSGDRPTTSILAAKLTPSTLGQLIALYEHITFVQGVVWGINSFDQWGVELGKQLAKNLAPAVAGDDEALAQEDSSTAGLIRWYLEHRED
ncbi:glucose-6-phosphate isomerase [Brachybacterium sp. UMB0905]|uniref:glucose-6-phosphate isomerase n=1 Tax=Brachybacterium sp. UMB0905 TaxID=2069310 RepID=UPI000C80ADD2|nr:glucose-6-phosphate isomerase [Brachybacterium sp. UMB0905]PMC75235.1 glucose-6-phosphate isomerase [Brachybacterium sp. UMB0905]